MTRLQFVVEGESEERFVRTVLFPHLQSRGIWCKSVQVETRRNARGEKSRGGGKWRQWLDDLRKIRGDRSADLAITTQFDLYGLPADFPRIEEARSITDPKQRAAFLETAMAEVVADRRLVPYLQCHEFEALVFAALNRLEEMLFGKQRAGLAILREDVARLEPEDIDDGRETAPSKRLMHAIPGYRKLTHGVPAVQQAGLPQLRARCPRFDAWIARLEALPPSRGHET